MCRSHDGDDSTKVAEYSSKSHFAPYMNSQTIQSLAKAWDPQNGNLSLGGKQSDHCILRRSVNRATDICTAVHQSGITIQEVLAVPVVGVSRYKAVG